MIVCSQTVPAPGPKSRLSVREPGTCTQAVDIREHQNISGEARAEQATLFEPKMQECRTLIESSQQVPRSTVAVVAPVSRSSA